MTDLTQQQCANLVRSLMEQKPWKDQQWARCALAIAARAVLRGRLLTEQEKMLNLAAAMEEDGDEFKDIAAKIRKAVIEEGTQ